MCRNYRVGHAQKMLGDDSRNFNAVETLRPHLRQNSFHRILDPGRSEGAKEPYLDFCRHEKEIPTRGMDLAIEGETIQPTDDAPFSRAGITLQPKEFRDQRLLFDQYRSDVYGWRHKSFEAMAVIEQA